MSMLLTVRDLRVRYPLSGGVLTMFKRHRQTHVDVVHGVSLDIQRGQTLAIVGESGSGKTTLAMALCGLAPVLGGDVRFDGDSVPTGAEGFLQPDRKRVALMFQDSVGSLSPRMTVRSLLAEPYRIHPGHAYEPNRSALDLLSLVGLGADFADRYPHQLSGGQARRVCVARALALKPELLIADEPTAGLDVSIQGETLNLLTELQREMGLGIMLITHNLNIVRHVADEVAIMYLGRFVELGQSSRVLRCPRHPYTAALLAANPGSDPDAVPQRTDIAGEAPSLLQRPPGCEFHTRCPNRKPDCDRVFPAASGTQKVQVWRCFHPLNTPRNHDSNAQP